MEVSRTIISKILLIAAFFSGSIALGQTGTPTPTPVPGSSGTMTIVGTPSGYSAYDAGSIGSGTVATILPTIYGGYTGTGGGCGTTGSPVSNSTCNSCDGSALASCNPTSIHPALVLSMTLQSSNTSITANTRVRWRFSGETTTHPVDNAALPAVTVNTPFTVEIKWANLCTYAGGSAACTTDITTAKTLSIGIDNNNDDTTLADKVDFNFVFRYLAAGTNNQLTATCSGTTAAGSTDQGICDYTVSRGDEKVYITDYAASSNDLIASLTNSAVKYNRLVLFYNEDASGADAIDGTTINNLSPSMTINLINNTPSEPSISDPRIRGLTNETFYCFALGNMDQTGIISYFPQTATLQDKTKVCAKPSQVVGLLDDKHCFIATATFGSSMAPEVQTFRQFRNEFLLTNRVGEQIVKFYYKVGPEGAEWISHSDSLRAMSVWALWPLLMFVKLSLWLGIVPATIVALLIAALIAFSVSRALQYRRSLREAA